MISWHMGIWQPATYQHRNDIDIIDILNILNSYRVPHIVQVDTKSTPSRHCRHCHRMTPAPRRCRRLGWLFSLVKISLHRHRDGAGTLASQVLTSHKVRTASQDMTSFLLFNALVLWFCGFFYFLFTSPFEH